MIKRSNRISVDSRNRLVIDEIYKETRKDSKVSSVTIARTSGGKNVSGKVVLDGKWSLTEGHDLKLHVLAKDSDIYGKTIILSGNIERVDARALVFRARTSEAISGMRSASIELKGWWRADNNNRLTFNVSKSRGEYDVLRFQGAWQVNKQNEIEYRYTKTLLNKRVKRESLLVFKGYWDVLGKSRFVYRLEGSSDSFFSFKASLQSRSLRSSSGKIKYQVGIKYTREKVYSSLRRVVTIYGSWKLGEGLTAGFSVDYSGGRCREVTFFAEKMVFQDGTLRLSLKGARDEKVGFEVTFRKAFKRDAELFLSLGRFASESRIEGGLRVRF